MRPIEGWLLTLGLVLGGQSTAMSQSSPGEYGGFPPGGNTNTSSLGPNLTATYGMLPGGFPVTGYNQPNQPNSFYGANYVFPPADGNGPTYFTYGTSGQPSSFYGANYVLPLPGGQGTFSYGPTSGQPASYYGANYALTLPGGRFTYVQGPTFDNANTMAGADRSTQLIPTVGGALYPVGPAPLVNQRGPRAVTPGAYFTPRLR